MNTAQNTQHQKLETNNKNQETRRDNAEQIVIAMDFGVKKMGVALGNTITQDARPLAILSMDNGQPDWQELLELIDMWKAQCIVVGLPVNMDGSDSALAKRAAKFARRVAHRLMELKKTPSVYLHDERLSSFEAREIAWEQGLITNEYDPIDDISAVLLLNSYFSDPDLVIDVTAYKPS